VENDVQQRAVNAQLAVVLDETHFAESIHKEADARARCPNHFRQRLLAHFGNHRLWGAIFAELCQQQQCARQPLLTGIEELVHQVFLNASVAAEKIRNEHLRKQLLLVQHPYHFRSFDLKYAGGGKGCRCGQALRLNCRDTFLSQEVANSKQRDSSFLAALGNYSKPDFALLDVKHGIGGIAL